MIFPVNRRLLGLFLLTVSCLARAEYGWLPKYQSLFLRAGFDYFHTSENYNSGGFREDIVFQSQLAELTDYRFWIEPEYGLAQDVSLGMRTSLVISSVDPQVSSPSGFLLGATGPGDIKFFLKWNVKRDLPLLTVETYFKLPPYSSNPLQPDDLVFGDGSFDFGGMLHVGYRIKRFFFTVAPGAVFRFGDYAPAVTFNGAVGLKYGRVHGVLFGDFFLSLGDNLLYDSSPNLHNAFGTGGSYARLSGSPTLFTMGAKVGVNLSQNYFLEAALTQAVSGRRAPYFTQVGLNFLAVLNFFKPEKRVKIREVPFDAKPEDSATSESPSEEPTSEEVP